MNWNGIKNGELLSLAAEKLDVFITLDKSIPYQQTMPETLAMIVLRLRSNRVLAVLALAPQVRQALETIRPGDRLNNGT